MNESRHWLIGELPAEAVQGWRMPPGAQIGSIRAKACLTFVLCLLCALPVAARIDPQYKECIQRGYKVEGEKCVFPDGQQCPIVEFNARTCGKEHMTEDYCVQKGAYVWDKGKCCDGLVAKAGEDDQLTCQARSLLGRLIRKPLFWVTVVILWIPIELTLAMRYKKWKSKR
jgi:hypothetical protein